MKGNTVNAAHALGLPGKIGELKRGAGADLIALPFSGRPADASAAVVNHIGDVSASLIGGEWALTPR